MKSLVDYILIFIALVALFFYFDSRVNSVESNYLKKIESLEKSNRNLIIKDSISDILDKTKFEKLDSSVVFFENQFNQYRIESNYWSKKWNKHEKNINSINRIIKPLPHL